MELLLVFVLGLLVGAALMIATRKPVVAPESQIHDDTLRLDWLVDNPLSVVCIAKRTWGLCKTTDSGGSEVLVVDRGPREVIDKIRLTGVKHG